MIFVIRHGETDGNAQRIVQLPHQPLSARGIAQAERLAARLAREGVHHILSSDLERAAMTAGCLRDATGAGIELDAVLQERNFGALRGTAYDDLDVADPFAPDYVPPEGESWAVFHARVERAWERVQQLAAATDGNLAVVTHGLVCASLALNHLPPLPGVQIDRFGNTALTVVEPGPPLRVVLLGCIAHLSEDLGPGGGDAGAV